ncbi:PqiC family protein [Chromobacterium vaccinii]|uniref:PqiC family protein n=1 Tax=Chromobacterium vaccinii TaxID=1108595 RepID=UPI003C756B2F
MKVARLSILVLALTGCAAPPTHFHQLAPLTPPRTQILGPRVLLGPVSLPAGMERPQLLVVDADGKPRLREFERWIAPLDHLLAGQLAAELSRMLGLASIHVWPQPGMAQGDFRLLVDVRTLRLQPGGEVELEAAWQLLPGAGGAATDDGYFRETVPVAATDEAAVAGLRELVRRLARQMAPRLKLREERAR